MSHRTALASVAAAAALLLAGCSSAITGLPYGAERVNPVGVWSETAADDSAYLSFSKDGTVSGYDGCNQLGGSWEATPDGLEFSELASTQMFCEDVDTWLMDGASAEISGGTMTVLDEDGEEVGVLKFTSETPVEA